MFGLKSLCFKVGKKLKLKVIKKVKFENTKIMQYAEVTYYIITPKAEDIRHAFTAVYSFIG